MTEATPAGSTPLPPGARLHPPERSFGPFTLSNDLVLSPMDGFSDLPFRSICRELGSALSYTEFINAIDIVGRHPHVHTKYTYREDERPVIFQIFDSQPERLLVTAQKLLKQRPDGFDINMGCSDNSVAGRGAGAGLLRTPDKIAEIFKSLTAALPLTVSGKIRLGWDDASRNHVAIARIVEDHGGAWLAVHARTKMQGYGGQADWDAIAEVKAAVSIPVIGNGDVRTAADIARLKAHTGCDAVMIGRAAIGNPWIFSRLDREQVPVEQVRAVILRHLQRSMDFYGVERGLIRFRKHASRYLSPHGLPVELRKRLLTAEQPEQFLALVDTALE